MSNGIVSEVATLSDHMMAIFCARMTSPIRWVRLQFTVTFQTHIPTPTILSHSQHSFPIPIGTPNVNPITNVSPITPARLNGRVGFS